MRCILAVDEGSQKKKKKDKKIHRRATFFPFPSYAHCITTAEAAAHV